MTSPAEVPVDLIATLRGLIGESDADDLYLATLLASTYDGAYHVNRTAATVWREKAATFSTLVDVSESGSSRKLSDLHKNALAMARVYDDIELSMTALLAVPRPRTRRIVRRD